MGGLEKALLEWFSVAFQVRIAMSAMLDYA